MFYIQTYLRGEDVQFDFENIHDYIYNLSTALVWYV